MKIKLPKQIYTLILTVFAMVVFVVFKLFFSFFTSTYVHAETGITLVGSIADTGSNLLTGPRSVRVLGKYAYVVSSGTSALTILDISDPATPSVVGELQDVVNFNSARFLEVSGNYVYILNFTDDLISSVDISNPAAPVIADTVSAGDQVWDMVVKGSYLYVSINDADTCLAVFDISVPTNITKVATSTSDATKCNGVLGVEAYGNYVYTTSSSGADEYFTVYDVSTPTAPVQVGSLSFLAAGYGNFNCQSIVYSPVSDHVYLAGNGLDGVMVIDVSTKTSPAIASVILDSTNMDAADYLVLVNKHIIIAGGLSNTLSLFDVYHPQSMTLAARFEDDTNMITPYDMDINGDYLFVPAVDSDTVNIFLIAGVTTANIDVSSPGPSGGCGGSTPPAVVFYEPGHPLLPKTSEVGSVILNWLETGGVSGYHIYYGLKPGEYIHSVINVPPTSGVNSYTIRALQRKTYFFAIQALAGCFAGPLSREWSFPVKK